VPKIAGYAMKWLGWMCFTHKKPLDTLVNPSFMACFCDDARNNRYCLHDEKLILIDGIQKFLYDLREEPNGSTDSVGVRERQIVYCSGDDWILEGPNERDLRLDFGVGR
jgi:hypothetical protein